MAAAHGRPNASGPLSHSLRTYAAKGSKGLVISTR